MELHGKSVVLLALPIFACLGSPILAGNAFSRSNSYDRRPSYGQPKKAPALDPELLALRYELCSCLSVTVKLNLNQNSQELYRLDQAGNAAKEHTDWKVNTYSTNGVLFTKFSDRLLKLPTYSALVALLDNYETALGRPELVTAKERDEQSTFLDQIIATPVMKKAWDFLKKKNLVPSDKAGFKDFLNKIWFTIYKRRGQPDTSGFEHVFVGEVDGTGPVAPVSGFHNWIRYYLEEKARRLTYKRWKGQTKPDVFGVEFVWNGHHKIKSTMAIGESPEMSMAVLTTCFLAVPNGECQLRMDNEPVSVITHKWDTRNPKDFYVASAYYDS